LLFLGRLGPLLLLGLRLCLRALFLFFLCKRRDERPEEQK
jgi:hypothetical protein